MLASTTGAGWILQNWCPAGSYKTDAWQGHPPLLLVLES